MKICKQCGKPIPLNSSHTRNVKYCSIKCRTKHFYHNYGREWQNKRNDKLSSKPDKNKIQCLVCGKWYRQVGSHIVQRHRDQFSTCREYREHFDLEVKKGIIPENYRQVKAQGYYDNAQKVHRNLLSGRKFWFKKGDKKAGRYKRSHITMERLKTLYKLNKRDRI